MGFADRVVKRHAQTAAALTSAVLLPFLGNSANAQTQANSGAELTNNSVPSQAVTAQVAGTLTLEEKRAEAAKILAEVKKISKDAKLINDWEDFNKNVFADIFFGHQYLNNVVVSRNEIFATFRDNYLAPDLAGKIDREEATAVYELFWSLLDNLVLPHLQELENQTLRGDDYGDRLEKTRKDTLGYGGDAYVWASKAGEVQQLIDNLNEVCPDKELTKTAETFLRSVVSIAIDRDKYLEDANQSTNDLFTALNNRRVELREEIRAGSPSIASSDWAKITSGTIKILNRATLHTKEVAELTEPGSYRDNVVKLNKLIVSRGKETAEAMLNLLNRSNTTTHTDKVTSSRSSEEKVASSR